MWNPSLGRILIVHSEIVAESGISFPSKVQGLEAGLETRTKAVVPLS